MTVVPFDNAAAFCKAHDYKFGAHDSYASNKAKPGPRVKYDARIQRCLHAPMYSEYNWNPDLSWCWPGFIAWKPLRGSFVHRSPLGVESKAVRGPFRRKT